MPREVWVLGVVSLLTDMSSELVHSLLPLYLVSTLGASMMVVGALDGAAEFVALLVKTFSGRLSDMTGKRKPLVLLGYGLSAVTKPFFPLADSIGLVVGARLIDRTGKGIRGAPRDALISDVTAPEQRGAAFGLRQSLDTIGAVLGPLLAIAGMLYFASDVRTVLWIAVIPGAIGVLLLALLVREPERVAPGAPLPADNNRTARIRSIFSALGNAYWRLVLFGMLLMFARGTEAFLVLRASNVGLADTWTPLTLAIMSMAYAMTSWPAGYLSDRMPRERLLVLGIVVLVVSHTLLSVSTNVMWILAGTALWGVHMGLTQGILSAMLADRSPKALRGTAFGLYATASGVALLVSGAVGGLLWQYVSPSATFLMGAIVGMIALLVLRSLPVTPPLRG